ncbi:MAG TPA: fasciclin domain-containing protein, partial [Flavobacterium sp.]
MKRFFLTSKMLSMLAVLAMTFSTVSCDEDDDHNPTETIATIAGRTENLSTLVTALQRADLVNTLNDKDVSYTVFAPTNQAFAAFLQAGGYEGGINDTDLTTEALRRILLNHVVNIETYAANLPTDGYLKTLAPSDNNPS